MYGLYNYLSTYWDRKISHFALIPLVFERLFGHESGTETSRALGLHNLLRLCFRDCKAAQIVHKQNKRDLSIICRVRLEAS